MQTLLTRWFRDESADRARAHVPRRGRVVALFDDGAALGPWQRRGDATVRTHAALAVESEQNGESTRAFLGAHAEDVALAVAFPACTDLSAAGARWWKKKRDRNPEFQNEAVTRIRGVEAALRDTGAPYAMLVPAAPLLKKMMREPSAIVSPHEYGGWLAPDAPHPLFPEVVPRCDAYVKRTYVYCGNGFVLPRRRPVAPVWATRRRKGRDVRVSPLLLKRKHRHLRRIAPLGFLEAVAASNS